ncbi:hypothetical protein LCGC14_2338840 [marine sediment metagenome]|uniref:TRASH domain-containing protein n=1 Tax=marine sediment metagenome TaxID=412755 RepID=A0A0F9EQD0_9ZZZZ
MISRTNIDLTKLRDNNKITCGICGEKFNEMEMAGKTVGKWFVICCEKCKKKKQVIGEVVYDPNEVDKTK